MITTSIVTFTEKDKIDDIIQVNMTDIDPRVYIHVGSSMITFSKNQYIDFYLKLTETAGPMVKALLEKGATLTHENELKIQVGDSLEMKDSIGD